MAVAQEQGELTDEQFERIAELVKSRCGIDLHDGKKELVKGRLAKRLRALGLTGFDQYIRRLGEANAGAEITAMLDALSTNQTSFFREAEHFNYFADELLPAVAARGSGRLRVWSAGCSSGEEPYSIAITVRESLPDVDRWDAKVLATDLSTRVLAQARQGVYPAEKVQLVPPMLRSRYFTCVQSRPPRLYEVGPSIRKLVHLAQLNLMGPWPMKGPFDAIFCRNVMIYFDRPTRERLVRRFCELLVPGGTFFVGHSESLTGTAHPLQYVQPTVYRKP